MKQLGLLTSRVTKYTLANQQLTFLYLDYLNEKS